MAVVIVHNRVYRVSGASEVVLHYQEMVESDSKHDMTGVNFGEASNLLLLTFRTLVKPVCRD